MLSIQVTDGSRPSVAVAGEIDMSTAAEFRLALEHALDGHDRVEIDLHHTSFMDSTGLAVLVWTFQRLGQNHEAVVLRDPSRPVLRLLELSGVRHLFDVRTNGSTNVPGDGRGQDG